MHKEFSSRATWAEIKELSTINGRNHKPVKVEIDEHGCWKIISHKYDSDGYAIFKRNGKDIKAHRLSHELFIGPINDGLCVLHSCDNPPCVNPGHLFLGTNLDNIADRDKKGRQVHGIKQASAKLNDNKVKEIRALAKQFPQAKLAKMFGVAQRTINKILTGKTWKHVDLLNKEAKHEQSNDVPL